MSTPPVSPAVASSGNREFPLLRYFSITALGLMLLAALALSAGYRLWLERDLLEQSGQANAVLTRAIYNAVDSELDNGSAQALNRADYVIRKMLRGTPVFRVKTYDLRGTVIYSTERELIGTSKGLTSAFVRARDGEIVTTTSYRAVYNEVEGETYERNLMSSYVPVRGGDGRVEAVFELYQDLPKVEEQAGTSSHVAFAAIFGVMLSLYGALLLVVQRGSRVIHQQRLALCQTNELLDASRQAAEQASRAKSAFLANMSHEMRTPLHGILGLATLLQHSPISAVQTRYVTSIEHAGKALLRIISDILDLSRIEAGRVTIVPAPFDLHVAIYDVVALMSPSAARKGLDFQVEVEPGLPVMVSGDATRLQQVLGNLVGNAVKFTERGSVRLSAAGRAQEGHVDLRFTVTDTGMGMSAELLERVFEPFTQADSSASRRQGGTGLGLSIAAAIAAAMQARIDVQSEPGQGSRFDFVCRLPVVEAQPCGDAGAEPAVEPADLPMLTTLSATDRAPRTPATRRVLLAEDNLVNQLYAQGVLSHLLHEVHAVENGRAAIDAWAHDGPFDAILMDCHMPECDGYEATRRIREQEARMNLLRTPIIAVTASVMPEDRIKCLQSGMDAVVSKPFSPQELSRALSDALALAAMRDAPTEAAVAG